MAGSAPPGDALVIRNRLAVAGWVFMAVWMAVLAAMTAVLMRDGPHPSQPAELQWGVIGAFWLVGIPVTAQLLAVPCRSLVVDAAGGVTIHRRSVLTREVEHFAPGTLSVAMRAAKDDEGDPVWRTILVAADGRERLAGEGREPADQERLAARLRAALGLLAESAPRP